MTPGAQFVAAHFSFPQAEDEREKAVAASTAIGAQLPLLSPEQDDAILREAGFSDVSLFYTGFTYRGWVGSA